MTVVGDIDVFAIEFGECVAGTKQLRRMSPWIGGHRLHGDDDNVYMVSAHTAMIEELNRLRVESFSREDLKECTPADAYDALEATATRYDICRYDLSVKSTATYFFEPETDRGVVAFVRAPHAYSRSNVHLFPVPRSRIIDVVSESLNCISTKWI